MARFSENEITQKTKLVRLHKQTPKRFFPHKIHNKNSFWAKPKVSNFLIIAKPHQWLSLAQLSHSLLYFVLSLELNDDNLHIFELRTRVKSYSAIDCFIFIYNFHYVFCIPISILCMVRKMDISSYSSDKSYLSTQQQYKNVSWCQFSSISQTTQLPKKINKTSSIIWHEYIIVSSCI